MPTIVGTITVMVTSVLLDRVHHRDRVEQRHDHRRAALRGHADDAAHRRRVEHRRLVQVDLVGGDPPRHRHVVQVEHLGALVEQHTLRRAGRAAGVHEDHRVVFVGLVGNHRRRRGEQLLVVEIVRRVAAPDQHHVLETDLFAHLVDHAGEERVREADLGAGVGEDEARAPSAASRRLSGLTTPAPRNAAWYSSRN